jgi:hypothetical protein
VIARQALERAKQRCPCHAPSSGGLQSERSNIMWPISSAQTVLD